MGEHFQRTGRLEEAGGTIGSTQLIDQVSRTPVERSRLDSLRLLKPRGGTLLCLKKARGHQEPKSERVSEAFLAVKQLRLPLSVRGRRRSRHDMIIFPNLIELDCAPQENDYQRRMQQSTRVKVTDSRAPLLLLALLQA